jgi:hypothetical protein
MFLLLWHVSTLRFRHATQNQLFTFATRIKIKIPSFGRDTFIRRSFFQIRSVLQDLDALVFQDWMDFSWIWILIGFSGFGLAFFRMLDYMFCFSLDT